MCVVVELFMYIGPVIESENDDETINSSLKKRENDRQVLV